MGTTSSPTDPPGGTPNRRFRLRIYLRPRPCSPPRLRRSIPRENRQRRRGEMHRTHRSGYGPAVCWSVRRRRDYTGFGRRDYTGLRQRSIRRIGLGWSRCTRRSGSDSVPADGACGHTQSDGAPLFLSRGIGNPLGRRKGPGSFRRIGNPDRLQRAKRPGWTKPRKGRGRWRPAGMADLTGWMGG